MTSDLLALSALLLPLGLQYVARCLEERQLRRQEFALWRHIQFVLAEARDHQRLWRVRFWGANGVVLDALWYSECGGAQSSAARSARPGVPRGQPSAPRLLACCRHLRHRRLP